MRVSASCKRQGFILVVLGKNTNIVEHHTLHVYISASERIIERTRCDLSIRRCIEPHVSTGGISEKKKKKSM